MTGPASPEAPFRLRLPATSANLGPAFDAAAIALDRYLEIEAAPAPAFSIACTGRDCDRCSTLEDNLIIETYKTLLAEEGQEPDPLTITMANAIPLGMGLGSSAASRLAAVALAAQFGRLGWTAERILEKACALEGHPDNAAACWLGGFVMAASDGAAILASRVVPPVDWQAIVVIPREPLATSKARAALPASYALSDVVANIQSAGLLGLAFAQGRADLLHIAMSDRIHQPWRAPICPLLDPLLPLAGRNGILGVALSGAGPAVLVIVEAATALEPATAAIRQALPAKETAELLVCRFETRGASHESP